jgi:hypothetical protein
MKRTYVGLGRGDVTGGTGVRGMRNQVRYWALAALALFAALAACAPPGDPPRLEGASLRNALRGATFEVIEPGEDAPTHYRFGCDGKWAALGGHVGRIDGRYSVSNDRYCVARTETYCFAVFRGQGSAHYIATDDGSGRLGYRKEVRRQGRLLPCGIGEG